MMIEWHNETCELGELVPWEQNPRRMTRRQAERPAASFTEFGQVETVAIGPDGEVYNGHQRLSVLLKLHGPEHTIEVRRASRPLTEEERRKLTAYLHAGAVGQWDWDLLAGWDMAELQEWGFDQDLLDATDADAQSLRELLQAEAAEEEIREEIETIKPRQMARVLISIPVDLAADARLILEQLEQVEGIEIVYGAN